MPTLIEIIIVAAIAVVALIIGFVSGIAHRRRTAEAKIGSAEKEANRMKSEAINQAEALKKESY